MNIPKIFWKYYDQYRRRVITITEYAALTAIDKDVLMKYLAYVMKNP